MTKDSDPKPPPQLSYLGSLFPATKDGWLTMVAEMNLKHAEGYEVVTVQKLDQKVGVIYRLARPKVKKRDASLVDDDDDGMPDTGDQWIDR